MLLEAVSGKLIALGLCTTVGTDLFWGSAAKIPPGNGPYTSLIEPPGPPPGVRTHDGQYAGEALQVLVRASGASVARAKCREHLNGVGSLYNVTLDGTFFLWIVAVQDTVIDMKVDERGLARFAFTLNSRSR